MSAKKYRSRRSGDSVNRIYNQLRVMVTTYQFRPNERINEVELADMLGVSRTPLREALNRLTAENLLTFVPNYGFAARALDTQTIYELYQLRSALETLGVTLAATQARDEEIDGLIAFWQNVSPEFADLPAETALGHDLEFHERLVGISGNTELSNSLDTINARLYFVRLVFMGKKQRRAETCHEHQAILEALKHRDASTGADLMQVHISRLQNQLVEVIRESITLIYTRDLLESPDEDDR